MDGRNTHSRDEMIMEVGVDGETMELVLLKAAPRTRWLRLKVGCLSLTRSGRS